MFLERFLRIHPVQSVVNDPTQLSGRGFPYIFYMNLVLSQLYFFWYSKIEVGPCKLNNWKLYVCENVFENLNVFCFPKFRILFLCLRKKYFSSASFRIHPVQSVINNPAQLSGRGFPNIFFIFCCRNFTFVWYSKMEARPCILNNWKFELCFVFQITRPGFHFGVPKKVKLRQQ